jgi:hypothetical protein
VNRTEDRPSPILIHDMMLAWQMPAVIFCDWWSTALQCFNHDFRPAHPAGSREDEGQLVVPEPIEEEGEHALFA